MNEIKRQVLPRGLWIVATPIGNMSDFSLRGRQALEESETILCEDTRRTAQLVVGIGAKRLERLDAHATPEKISKVVERLAAGERFALVSDAGTPSISDPGAELVRAARAAGIAVVPIPGPSAVVTLLSVSGFNETAFVFRGFFPRKSKDQAREIETAVSSPIARVFVWFESPERVVDALELIAEKVPGAEVVAAKELTKVYEHVFAGLAGEVAAEVKAEVSSAGARGEWCFAVLFPKKLEQEGEQGSNSSDWVKALRCLIEARIPASEAAKRVSQHFGVKKNLVYEEALKISKKK